MNLGAALRRVVTTLPVLWVVVTVVFLMIHLVPGDPIVQMLGDGATASDVSSLRHAYKFDLPLHTQYFLYLRGLLHGDLGQSLRLHDSVLRLILQRYPFTLALTVAATLLGVVVAIPAGVASARRANQWSDRTLSVVSLFGLSFPTFALGPILILVFAIGFGWLPVSGAGVGRRGFPATSGASGGDAGAGDGGDPDADGANVDAGRAWT